MTHRNLAAGFGAIVLTAGLMMAQTQPAPAPGRNWAAHRLDKVADLLNLTANQKTQVENILQNARTQARALAPQLRTNHEALANLIKTDAAGSDFDAKLESLANQQSSLISQMIVIHGKAMAQVWSLLTPEQQQKAGDLFGLMGGHGFGGFGHFGGRMHGMRGPAATQ